jgi:hypothetical protein
MKVAILQPSYIPWRGYFHQIFKSDLFIFYDDVQYDKHGWRNRNRIKTSSGSIWLTIPVLSAKAIEKKTVIKDICIDSRRAWHRKHWLTVQQAYGNAPYFKLYEPIIAEFYKKNPQFLADFIIDLTISISKLLGITHTKFLRSSDLSGINGNKTGRLIQILKKVGATHYISGPSARDYLDEKIFQNADITIEYMQYFYPLYLQLHPPFDPQVSILDLLFMVGPESLTYILKPEERKL